MPNTPRYDSGLMWFRRDLRVDDNAALYHALRQCRKVWCAFVFDTAILEPLRQRGLLADRRVEFIHESLVDLDEQLRALGRAHGTEGVGLIVRHAAATEAIPRWRPSWARRRCLPTTTTTPTRCNATHACWGRWRTRARCCTPTRTT